MDKVTQTPKVMKCSCKHAFQDSHYGYGMRLHNEAYKCYRCTVCGNEKAK